MNILKRYTGEVIHSGEFETMKELILDAISSYANLRNADLSDADLSNANLRNADLRNADLSDANLRNADLSDANLWGCAGNRSQIKSLFISDVYSITYTSKYLQIGCERHAISDWWEFDNKRIAELEKENAELKGALTALRQRKCNRVILMDKIPPKEQGE